MDNPSVPNTSSTPVLPVKHKRHLVLWALLALGVLVGYFGYRSGFSFQFSKFFAANGPTVVLNTGAGPYQEGDKLSVSWSKTDAVRCDSLNGWVDTGGATQGTAQSLPIDACVAGSGTVRIQCTLADGTTQFTDAAFSINQASCPSGPTPTPTQTPVVLVTPSPTTTMPAQELGIVCSSYSDIWTQDGVTVCVRSSNLTNDRCTMDGNQGPLTYEVGIINNSGHPIFSRAAQFYCSSRPANDVCGALDNNSGSNCTTQGANVTGDLSLPVGGQGITTYHLTPGACGSYQIDDTWGGGAGTFVIGNVVETGTNCAPPVTPTPTPSTIPTETPTPTPSTTFSPTPTPSFSATPTPTLSTTPTPSLTPTPTLTFTPTPTFTPVVGVALGLQKTVRNVTQNGAEAKSVNANPSETVEFTIRVSNTGTLTATQVVARDSLPAGLTYQTGSTTVDGVLASDGILSGLNLGDIVAGRTVTVRFLATAASAGFFSNGSTTLANTAFVQATNAPSLSDVAFVTVNQNIQNAAMSVVKLGINVTRAEVNEHSPIYASPNDTIQFNIHVRAIGSGALTNVTVRDIVPSGIIFIPGSARIADQALSDSIATSGVNIGSLSAGQEVIVSFSGRVAPSASLPSGMTTLINTAQVSATSIPVMTAQLPIVISNTIGATTIPTGPGESVTLALVLSAITTLLYVGYAGTDVYRRREAKGIIKSHQDFDLR